MLHTDNVKYVNVIVLSMIYNLVQYLVLVLSVLLLERRFMDPSKKITEKLPIKISLITVKFVNSFNRLTEKFHNKNKDKEKGE
nr:MAG: hypothetical protein [Microvirus Sku110]